MSRYRSQIREVINRNTVVSLALEQGFNAYLPVYDGGVDFILYREEDGTTHNVQLKGRWIIDQKYIGRNIWVAFPDGDDWYLVPHDEMVKQGDTQGFTRSASWVDRGAYSCPGLSKTLLAACAPYRFQKIAAVAAEAAEADQLGSHDQHTQLSMPPVWPISGQPLAWTPEGMNSIAAAVPLHPSETTELMTSREYRTRLADRVIWMVETDPNPLAAVIRLQQAMEMRDLWMGSAVDQDQEPWMRVLDLTVNNPVWMDYLNAALGMPVPETMQPQHQQDSVIAVIETSLDVWISAVL